VIRESPLEAGTLQVTVAELSPATALTSRGALGFAAVAADDTVEKAKSPAQEIATVMVSLLRR
jgi:hypothetical protein